MVMDCDKREIRIGDLVTRLPRYATDELGKRKYKVIEVNDTDGIKLKGREDDGFWDAYRFKSEESKIDNWQDELR